MPTPVMENVPISPNGTEPFNSVPNTPLEEPDHQTLLKARPQNLPIPAAGDYIGSPVSDNILLTVMLFLQHENCSNRKTCGTCKLIKRQFEKIVERNGQEAVQEAIKNIQTPDTERHRQLRRREKRPTPVRSPMHSLGVKFERQRSHSASHLHDEELIFSSTETEDDERTHRRKRQTCKAVTDDEYSTTDDTFERLPLSAIGKEVSLSEPDLTPTPGIPLSTTFFKQAALQSYAIPTKQETVNSDDNDSTCSDPCLATEESIIPSNLKTLPKRLPPHLQKYDDSSSSGVYSSSDTGNSSLLRKTLHLTNYHIMYPVSSDKKLSLSDRDSSPTPLLPQSSSPNHMTYPGNKHRSPSPINIVLPSEGSSATPL